MEGLSINSIEATNEDVNIVFTPSSDVTYYSYVLIKDNAEYKSGNNIKEDLELILTESGVYKLKITTYNKNNVSTLIESGEYVVDKEKPVIKIGDKTYKMTTKEVFNYNDIIVTDNYDGNITSSVKSNINDIDFTKEGIKKVNYTVSDKAGNISSETIYVTVVKDTKDLVLFGKISIGLIAIVLITLLYKYIRSVKLEKRFSSYTINSSKNKYVSLFDNLYSIYNKVINTISNFISKSNIINKISKRYDKYVDAFELDSNINIVSKKIFVGLMYIILAIIVKIFKSTLIEPYEMIIPFIIGYYTLDIIYAYKYLLYRRKIENDMLEAITIMNNAFKSGRSIIQAINLVSTELDGPIAREFKKISLELSFGLDVELAFSRFSDRIKIPEAVYLTSSLSVLNKTGGNIIKVFSSIEKTLFNRKKLQVELKSLTASSKLIMYVLMLVPIAFIFIISVINKEYFEPMFTNPLGIALLLLIVIIYVMYIFIVRKVMKVRI